MISAAHYYRRRSDIRRQILNYLNRTGPNSITDIVDALSINHTMAQELIKDAILSGIIAPEIRPRITRYKKINPVVQVLLTITPEGIKELNKMNKLQSLIDFNAPAKAEQRYREEQKRKYQERYFKRYGFKP